MKNINLQAWLYAITESSTTLRDLDLRPSLSKIQIPAVIFHGPQDKLRPFAFAGQLQKSISNSRIVNFANSGHALFVVEADKFNTELEKFARQ